MNEIESTWNIGEIPGTLELVQDGLALRILVSSESSIAAIGSGGRANTAIAKIQPKIGSEFAMLGNEKAIRRWDRRQMDCVV